MNKVEMSLEEFLNNSKENSNTLMVIDFKASWCGPCKTLTPFMEELVPNYPDVVFYVIDSDDDETEEIVDHFNIKALPSIVYLKNGEVVDTVIGVDKQKIEDTINDNL